MATNAAQRGDAIDRNRRAARSRRLLLGALALVPPAAVPAQAAASTPVPAAALRQETITIGDQPVRADVGPGGVWAVATDLSFVQRIDPRSNEPMGPRITTLAAVKVTIDQRGIWVTRSVDTTATTFERVRLARESGAQIGEPEPVPPPREKDANGKFRQRLSRGWEIETTADVHDFPIAVRRDFYGAELQRVRLGLNYVTSTAVDHRGALWVGGYPSARRVLPGAERAQAVVAGARQGAIAVGQNAAWLVGQSARSRNGIVTLTKRLFRVDLRAGRQVGKPLTLGSVVQGSRYRRDLAVNHISIGKGSAWISGPTPGTLTRVILSKR